MAETNITGPLWGYEQRSRRLAGLWPTRRTLGHKHINTYLNIIMRNHYGIKSKL
jgi:hypothetical protein